MKITMNIECTPEEARAFLGLPDVAPLQQGMMDQMKAQFEKTLHVMDPESFVKMLFPQSGGLAELQKAFWNQFTGGRGNGER